MTDTIQFSRSGAIARLALNKPQKHNSLGQLELKAIQGYLAEVEASQDIRVLIVTATGNKTFCAGAALDELGAGKISGDHFQAVTEKLAGLAIPTIAALNGNVFGGGVELALSCDFRIGVEGSRMRVPAAAIGLCYPISGINRFVERLGANVARRILVASEEFQAEDMLNIAFLDHLVTADELESRTQELAEHIAALAPLAVRAMKDILQQATGTGIDREAANVLLHLCLESDDLQEGFAAQREKRRPQFRGI